MQMIKVRKLFQRTLFGVFALFGFIGISTSFLLIDTVNSYLSEEYENNSLGIAQTIADASVDILLNRDLSSLQSLIDQFVEIQGINYVYIRDETGEFLAHTFVPGIPEVILNSDPSDTSTVERQLPGMGDFVEVSRPILAGVAGAVHVGMDTGIIALQVQRAIGRQVYLISIVFVLGVVAAIWLVNLAARPIGQVLTYAVALARGEEGEAESVESVLGRKDEAGHLLPRRSGRLGRDRAAQTWPEKAGVDREHIVLQWVRDRQSGTVDGSHVALLPGLRGHRRRGDRSGVCHARGDGGQMVPGPQGARHGNGGDGFRNWGAVAEQVARARTGGLQRPPQRPGHSRQTMPV